MTLYVMFSLENINKSDNSNNKIARGRFPYLFVNLNNSYKAHNPNHIPNMAAIFMRVFVPEP